MLQAAGLVRRIGDREVLAGVDLALATGETLVVRGPSGAGKTVLLRALAWLDPLSAGSVTLAGRSPSDWGQSVWRSRVAYVAQRAPDLPGCPLDHVAAVAALGAQQGREVDDPVALAEDWGLPADAMRQGWATLSGGERQRAYLAILLARRPDVLLLDEPTSSLDDEASAAVEATLAGRSVVWVTHDKEQAERLGGRALELGG